jgi:septum formation protein
VGATRLILASASPRRQELLDQLGVSYTCAPANIDETPNPGERPSAYVQRMSQNKAKSVANRLPSAGLVILAADTVVVIDDNILGKPSDHRDARNSLMRLSGRKHTVLTAVCLIDGSTMSCETVETEVEFLTLQPEVIEAYLMTEEPWDKAGAYGIQGAGGAFVRSLQGSYSNVVGLPLSDTWQLLSSHGISSILNASPST